LFRVTTAQGAVTPPPPGSSATTPTVPFMRRLLGDEAVVEFSYWPHMETEAEAQKRWLTKIFPEAEFKKDHPPLEPCHPGCFPRGTLVATPQGDLAIESLVAGDEVLSLSAEGMLQTASVASVFTTSNRLWDITTSAGIITTTEIQPFRLADGRILPAGQLEPGDELLWRSGDEIVPTAVRSVHRNGRTEPVLNLVLQDGDYFFASGVVARCKPPVAE
jgi:hypothetical protein